MGFARATRSERNDVFAPLDPFATGKFQHLHLVELRDRLEVEAVQALLGGELCSLDPTFDHPSLAINQFQFDKSGEELDVVQALGCTLARQLLVLPQEGRELQRLEVMSKQDLRSTGHAASPDSRDM